MDQGAVAPYYDWFDRALASRQPILALALVRAGLQVHDKLIVWLQVRPLATGLRPAAGAPQPPPAQTAFVTLLPLGTAARVWDMFLLEGVPYLMRTALAIFDLLAPALLRGAAAAGGSTGHGGADSDADRIQVRRWRLRVCGWSHPVHA